MSLANKGGGGRGTKHRYVSSYTLDTGSKIKQVPGSYDIHVLEKMVCTCI